MAEESITGSSNCELFDSHIDDVLVKYPGLNRNNREGKPIIMGTIDIVDKSGKYWDSYNIEIHCSDKYPYRYPDLYETSNKIPKIGDWHVYEDTLTCCVTILPKEILRCKQGITLLEYLDEEVMPYFFNQTHRRVEGYYANGEYLHGAAGIYQYYAELFRVKSIKELVVLMIWIVQNPKPVRTSLCFCGSGIKYRHCHKDVYEQMILMGQDILSAHASILIDAYKLLPGK